MNKAVTFTRLFLLFMTFAATGVAQTAAELRGVVADEFGAIIRNATISLEDGAGRKSAARTDGAGQFRFTGLAPRTYTLTATAAGFAASTRQVMVNTGAAHRPRSMSC